MADSEVRQRKPQAEEKPGPNKLTKPRPKDVNQDGYSPWLDILRVLSFLFMVSCILSYFISNGESYMWNMKNKPDYLRTDYWKAKMQGPINLTPEELSAYDGTDPDKPIYLAINGTIYDVSSGRRMYGPEGSYHIFAGCDASRGFVTGCFVEDRTADMRGVELMYLPLDDPEVDAHWTTAEMEALRAQELEEAQLRVYNGLKHWVDFFGNSKKYFKVGEVKREKNWLEKTEKRELCATAQKGRRKRVLPE